MRREQLLWGLGRSASSRMSIRLAHKLQVGLQGICLWKLGQCNCADAGWGQVFDCHCCRNAGQHFILLRK